MIKPFYNYPKRRTSKTLRIAERRQSRDSSEGDLVHVSEFSSINNGGSPPQSGEATPVLSENQQVDLKFERRDSQASAQKPHLGTRQRRDFKGEKEMKSFGGFSFFDCYLDWSCFD